MADESKITNRVSEATPAAAKKAHTGSGGAPAGVRKLSLQLFLALVILALGIAAMFVLTKLRKPPKRAVPEKLAPLVKVQQLEVRDIPMVVSGFGTISPKVEVEIVPQISGMVVSINPRFKAGGFIKANQPLLQIDPRDYELAVQQAQAAVAEAQVKLDLERAEAKIVRSEWEQLYPGTEPDSPLVRREPQIRQAEARLASAKAALQMAKLSLERTTISLPIDVRIVNETVDLGQYCTTGKAVGNAYGVEMVEIELPLEDKELAWFDMPDEPVSLNGNHGPKTTATVVVRAKFAGAEHTWAGRVVRTTGRVDRASRLISVVVEVEKPFDKSDSKPPLMPGTFVEVLIQGKVLKNAVAVPRDAIRSRNQVWLVNENTLHVKSLDIVRFEKEFAYVTSGLPDQAVIVVSSLDTVVDGMRVRTQF